MDKYIISIFDNKSFSEMLSEINIFSKFEIKHYKSIDYFKNNHESLDELLIFFNNNITKDLINNGKLNNKPLILVSDSKETSNFKLSDFSEIMTVPFKIIDFKKKVISLISKVQFRKNSLIYLNEYILDKNERKIKKKDLELKLSEKEINFLILFSKRKEPISKNLVLKEVWNYSSEIETHTLETHIHNLRKKFLEKFNDNNFIKNNNKGYFI
jgi:DNA-binding response OmpR family regulator